MTPLPCPCGRGMRAVLPDFAGNPVRLADRCKQCSGEAFPDARRAVPRKECKRCDQWYSQGTGCIGPCKDSTYRHGPDGPGWRDPLHEWQEIEAADASPPGPARERATALIDALNKDGGGHVVHGALQAAMIAEANASDAARTPPRTLPVTPAERACATVLRAWLEWHETPPEPRTNLFQTMLNLGDWLADEGIVEGEHLDLTSEGAALLARVEAAERTPPAPPGICQGQMRAYRCALPVGHTGLHADEGRFTLWPDAADTRPVVDAADAKGLT